MIPDNYVYKKEVDWSLLTEGVTLSVESQVVFGQTMGRFLTRGEKKDITFHLYERAYKATINNVKFSDRYNRVNDTLQIRYDKNGDLAKAFQEFFSKSYSFIKNARDARGAGDGTRIKLPKDDKEYLVIYSTERGDSYILETIAADEFASFKQEIEGVREEVLEFDFNSGQTDSSAGILSVPHIAKIRKLDRRIGENLKKLYDYRCQICGEFVGHEYDSRIVEAHHIDFFATSLNNDASNQMVVCPNHHSIIHAANPVFDRNQILYRYQNGIEQRLLLNRHL